MACSSDSGAAGRLDGLPLGRLRLGGLAGFDSWADGSPVVSAFTVHRPQYKASLVRDT